MSLLLGWGLMHGIKIPQQDFALKRLGGGIFVGHYSESDPSSWSEPERVTV